MLIASELVRQVSQLIWFCPLFQSCKKATFMYQLLQPAMVLLCCSFGSELWENILLDFACFCLFIREPYTVFKCIVCMVLSNWLMDNTRHSDMLTSLPYSVGLQSVSPDTIVWCHCSWRMFPPKYVFLVHVHRHCGLTSRCSLFLSLNFHSHQSNI